MVNENMTNFLVGVAIDRRLALRRYKFLQHSKELLDLQLHNSINDLSSNLREQRELTRRIMGLRNNAEEKRKIVRAFKDEQNQLECDLLQGRRTIALFVLNTTTIELELTIICSAEELERLGKAVDLRVLPPEIRQEIFEMVLPQGHHLTPKDRHSGNPFKPYALAILRTAKWVWHETYPIFCSQNCFSVTDFGKSTSFPHGASCYITHLTLKISSRTSMLEILRSLEGCKMLKRLHVILISLPAFRGREDYKRASLEKLKFKRPANLNDIQVEVESLLNLEEARSILHTVLKDGRCEQPATLRRSGRKALGR
jgi:hypothetical protein